MHLAARFAGESVRDPLLEPVPDLDPDLPLLDREEDQQPVVLLLVADAAAVVLEHLDGVLADVAVRLDGRDRRDHHDVAAGRFQRAAQPIDLAALLASMTWAKSLTGATSRGEDSAA